MLTYQDYLQNANLGAGSETGAAPLTEQQWNALPVEEKWRLTSGSPGGRIGVTPADSRYAELARLLGGGNDRTIMLQGRRLDDSRMVDPARQIAAGGGFAHVEDNETPGHQAEMDISDTGLRNFALMAAAVLGGGLAYGAAAGGAGAAGAGATDGLAGLGASEVGTAGAAGAPAAGGAAAPSFGNVLGGSSTTAGAAGSGLAGLGANGAATGATGGIGSFLGNNAGTLARLGLAGLAAGGSSGGSSGSSGGSGTPGDVNSIINAMADANRVNHSTPLGSRQWTQGPDGRWSVADTLNPAEQANFENVQGMNADVTGMARQRDRKSVV